MNNIFNYESGFMSTLGRITDSVILGLLWLICSIPIVTVGAASAAFYHAYNKCVRHKMDYAWKTFFTSFRTNFKQATLIWLIVLGIGLLAAADYYLLGFMDENSILTVIIQSVITVAAVIGVAWILLLFPFLSRFENSNKAVMKCAALITMANLPQSVLLLIVFAASVFLFTCLPVLNLFIPSIYMLCANRILEKIFSKYMPPQEPEA